MTALQIDVATLPTTKQVKRMITTIAASGKRLDAQIHATALACLGHAAQFGDTRLFASLYEAMPKGGRRKALAYWAMKSSPYFLHDDAAKGLRFGVYKPELKAYKPWDWDALTNIPFYEVKGAEEALGKDIDALKAVIADLTSGDITKMIARMADKIEAALEGTSKDGKVVANDDKAKVQGTLEALRKLVA